MGVDFFHLFSGDEFIHRSILTNDHESSEDTIRLEVIDSFYIFAPQHVSGAWKQTVSLHVFNDISEKMLFFLSYYTSLSGVCHA